MTATHRIAELEQRILRHRACLPECLATSEPERRKGAGMRQRLQLVVAQRGANRHVVN
jgi:hypothetical protein